MEKVIEILDGQIQAWEEYLEQHQRELKRMQESVVSAVKSISYCEETIKQLKAATAVLSGKKE